MGGFAPLYIQTTEQGDDELATWEYMVVKLKGEPPDPGSDQSEKA
jgi:hypothetical protein